MGNTTRPIGTDPAATPASQAPEAPQPEWDAAMTQRADTAQPQPEPTEADLERVRAGIKSGLADSLRRMGVGQASPSSRPVTMPADKRGYLSSIGRQRPIDPARSTVFRHDFSTNASERALAARLGDALRGDEPPAE